jgi:hypothetical protein
MKGQISSATAATMPLAGRPLTRSRAGDPRHSESSINTNHARVGNERSSWKALSRLACSVAAAGLLAALAAIMAPLSADAATTGSFSGRVTNASSHEPLQRIQVCAIREVNAHEFRTTGCQQTDSEGRYTVSVEPGSYKIEFNASACGFGGCTQENYVTQYYKNKTRLQSADPVSVEAGKTAEHIDAEMQVGGEIAGTVTKAATHGAIAHIRVCALEPEGMYIYYGHCGETDSQGNYTIAGLPTAKDLVEFSPGFDCGVNPCRRLNYITQYWKGKSAFEEAEHVGVEAGKKVENVNAEMQVGGQITGKVTKADGHGTAIERTLVCAQPATPGRMECELTDANGEYTISGLATGNYKVEFSGRTCPPLGGGCPIAYGPRYWDNKSTLAEAESVKVEAGSKAEGIDAELVPSGVVNPPVSTPVSTSPPVLSGPPVVGETLRCSQGVWENEPSEYHYRWLRDGEKINGQSGSTYAVVPSDAGHEISCEVTAQNGAGSASSASSTVLVEPEPPNHGPGGGAGGGTGSGGTVTGSSGSGPGSGGTVTGSGGSGSGSGSGSGAGGSHSGSGGGPPGAGSKPLSQAQRLAHAIAACRKLQKSKRAGCIATAKKHYRKGHKTSK